MMHVYWDFTYISRNGYTDNEVDKKSASQVQILAESAALIFHNSALEKGINSSLLPPERGRQDFCIATNLREGKPWIPNRVGGKWKSLHYLPKECIAIHRQ